MPLPNAGLPVQGIFRSLPGGSVRAGADTGGIKRRRARAGDGGSLAFQAERALQRQLTLGGSDGSVGQFRSARHDFMLFVPLPAAADRIGQYRNCRQLAGALEYDDLLGG